MSLTENEYNNELNQINNISLLDVVNYIKNSIDAIVSLKVEDKIDEYNSKKMKIQRRIMNLYYKKKKLP